MELEKYKERSYEYTAKASEIARSMMLAGIGIVWIIRTDKNGLTLSHPELLWPLMVMAITMFIDFAQYFLGGIIWIQFYRHYEKRGKNDKDDVTNEKLWRKNVLYMLYYAKFIGVIIAYILILRSLFHYY